MSLNRIFEKNYSFLIKRWLINRHKVYHYLIVSEAAINRLSSTVINNKDVIKNSLAKYMA